MAASVVYYGDEQMELPPGFRFHPTDEELISHYLYPKVFDPGFSARAIGDVDLNKVEPWELPWKAKLGEKEWYFFCVRDRKYPTGMRTNRATEAGYWKATGKDKEIYQAKTLVGMKKTLVFYRGRAPKGEKTNWVMHEYRLDGKFSIQNLPKSAKGEWVISRVFQKTAGGKKIPITGLARMGGYGGGGEFEASNLPPLMDISSVEMDGQTTNGETSHVTCFSESMEDQKHRGDHVVESSTTNNNHHTDSSFVPNPFQMVPNTEYQDSMWTQDPAILRLLFDNNEPNSRPYPKAELTHNTGMISSSGMSDTDLGQRISHFADQDYEFNLSGSVDMDSLWNY